MGHNVVEKAPIGKVKRLSVISLTITSVFSFPGGVKVPAIFSGGLLPSEVFLYVLIIVLTCCNTHINKDRYLIFLAIH